MARPSALTPELRERIEAELAQGVPVVVVAQNVGVSKSTVHSWLGSGRVVRRRPADPLDFREERPAEDGSYTTLDPDLGRRSSPTEAEPEQPSLDAQLAAAEPALVGVVLQAARRGSWQAALDVLERTLPERWARPSRARPLEVVATAPNPMQDVLDELDQVRQRRVQQMRGTR